MVEDLPAAAARGPRIWWRMPGSPSVEHWVPDPEGSVVFVMEPFEEQEDAPALRFRGRVEPSDFPQVGTVSHGRQRPEEPTTQAEHLAAVESVLRDIAAGHLVKAVLSRMAAIAREAPGFLEPEVFFQAKSAEHPHAFVYLLDDPVAGVWAGASPELLVGSAAGDVAGTGVPVPAFETVSLAGTRRGEGAVSWTNKERTEQEVVTEYIRTALLRVGAEGVSVAPATDRRYGVLTHLASRITGRFAGPLWELAAALHPTPAVGGAPLDRARARIAELERVPRRYYAGYLGPWRGDGHPGSRFFVNLRCAEWTPAGMRLHAGGGIVQGSQPQAEWEETEAKLQSIRSLPAPR